MSDSRQHTLDRVRRPRVQVTYDVDTGGATESKELPLVVGVMADLSGQPAQPNAPLKERKFVPIDRDNFDEVLAKSNARVSARVDNKLTDDDTQMSVDLRFRSLEDFEPEQVARQVPALREAVGNANPVVELVGQAGRQRQARGTVDGSSRKQRSGKELGVGIGQ
ncbi:MAG: type VI secretion system contractile sheath small subunit [Pirellulaceae bacterium]